jgi:hypothetical protein
LNIKKSFYHGGVAAILSYGFNGSAVIIDENILEQTLVGFAFDCPAIVSKFISSFFS